jgi:hypothetical protein
MASLIIQSVPLAHLDSSHECMVTTSDEYMTLDYILQKSYQMEQAITFLSYTITPMRASLYLFS